MLLGARRRGSGTRPRGARLSQDVPPLPLPPPHPEIPGPSLRARWEAGQKGCHLLPRGRPASPSCPQTEFQGSLILAWRGPGEGVSRGGPVLRAVGTACSECVGAEPAEPGGQLRGSAEGLGACRGQPVPGRGLFPHCTAPLSSLGHRVLLFSFYSDSFENPISKGNCGNVNHDREARACVGTHASPVMGCSKNTPRAH